MNYCFIIVLNINLMSIFYLQLSIQYDIGT